MKSLDPDERETPIEEYPGFVGLTWDGEFFPGPEMKALKGFPWRAYWELIDECDQTRVLVVNLALPIELKIARKHSELAHLLDQMPSIEVRSDSNPDGGPASGSGFVFFLADGVSTEQLVREITLLRGALDKDLQQLSELCRSAR
jgi:hypothetical protein